MGLSFNIWPVGAVDRCVAVAQSLAAGGRLGERDVAHLRFVARQFELPAGDDEEIDAFLSVVLADPRLDAVRPVEAPPVEAPPVQMPSVQAIPVDGPPVAARPAAPPRSAPVAAASGRSRSGRRHVDVGTMGHLDHGKTTLTAAITALLHDRHPGLTEASTFGQIDQASEATVRGIPFRMARLEYQTENRHYAHVDCPRHTDYVKSLMTGAAHMDAAILVVAATDGVMPQTRDHVALAHYVGISTIVVALNKADLVDDEEILDLVETEVRELLDSCGFRGDEVPVVRISARKALEGDAAWGDRLLSLVDALDTAIPDPEPATDADFLMPVEDVFRITGRGIVVTGRVERGQVSVGEDIELVGLRSSPVRATVAGVEKFRKLLDRAYAGDNVGLLLRGLSSDDVERGQVVVRAGGTSAGTHFDALVYVAASDERGRSTPFTSGYRPDFYFRTTDVTGVVTLPSGSATARPGEVTTMTVELVQPIALEEGLRFALREGGRTVGVGRVTRVIS